jgi:hypothetical protein
VAVAAHLPAGAGDALTHASGVAFSDALGIGMIVAAAVVGLSALAVRRLLPDARTVEPAERVEADAALPVGVVGQTA